MNSKLLLLAVPLFLSCTSVSIHFDPVKVEQNACPAPKSYLLDKVKTIAVLPFENSSYRIHQYVNPISSNTQKTRGGISNGMDLYEYIENDGSIASDICEQVLLNSNKFKVVERKKIEQILREQKFSASGLINDSEIKLIGNLSGADAFLFGRVIKAYTYKDYTADTNGNAMFVPIGTVTIQFKLLDVQTGEIIWTCISTRTSLNYLVRPITVSNRDILRGKNAGIPGILFVGEKNIQETLASIFK